MRKVLLFALLFSFLYVPAAFAQQVTVNDFSLVLVPENPRPLERVSATIQSYSVDVNQVLISWTYGGKTLESGIGKKTVAVQAGAVSSRQVLEATIRTTDGVVVRKSAVVAPAAIDLLWEAIDAYTPPFYKGKPLPASEGLVRVSAFPERATQARTFSYTWSKNGIISEDSSGYGRIGFLYKNSYLDPQDSIEVGVRRADSTVLNDTVTVPTSQPFFRFYRNRGGFTDYTTALLGTYSMQEQTETFIAEPFFFSALKPVEQTLVFAWSINGEGVPGADRPNELVLDRGDGSGSAQVEMNGKHQSFITQLANSSFRLTF